jgi:hypothetical protein
MTTLDELLQRVAKLPPQEQLVVLQEAELQTHGMRFVPNPGPQTDAYLSAADVLLYGGQAGGGKTYLELGWAINEADNGIIFRRERTQTDGLEREGKNLIGLGASFNGSDLEWTWPGGKTLKLGGMQMADDWQDHAGRERDYMAFDEGGEFMEQQVASIIAWLRAAPGKRTRVIIGSNPPRTSDGFWLVKWFAPWLDDKFANPAAPGELRWALRVSAGDDIEMVWVAGPGEYEVNGEPYTAQSYTFIPASLEDNPYRNTPEYRAKLQSLPEPLRSQLLYGKFATSLKDLANQCIPSEWVRMAMERRKSKREPPPGVPMCAIGVDCAGGGKDYMVQAPRWDGWYGDLVKTPGSEIPQDKAGAHSAGLVLRTRRDGALVVVDMGGGYGGPLYEHLKANEIESIAFKGAETSTRRSRDGKLKFVNKRTAAYWLFMEALDPNQPGGSPIYLPDDRRLFAGLTAPTFEVTPHGIKLEPKVKHDPKTGKVVGGVAAKLGFSPDEADAVVMAWYEGPKRISHALDWMERTEIGGRLVRRPQVLPGGRRPLSAKARR